MAGRAQFHWKDRPRATKKPAISFQKYFMASKTAPRGPEKILGSFRHGFSNGLAVEAIGPVFTGKWTAAPFRWKDRPRAIKKSCNLFSKIFYGLKNSSQGARNDIR